MLVQGSRLTYLSAVLVMLTDLGRSLRLFLARLKMAEQCDAGLDEAYPLY